MKWKQNWWKLLLPVLVLGILAFAFFQGGEPAAPKAAPSPETSLVPAADVSAPESFPSPSVTASPTAAPSPSSAPAASPAVSPAAPTPSPTPSPSPTPVPTAAPTPTPSPSPTETPAPEPRCTVSISCAAVLDNMEALAPEKAGLIPDAGVILSQTETTFSEGESVLDVLKRVCRENGIHLDFLGGYVQGIGNLYEMDCGPLSGWTYSVNGWSPNYGCDQYTVADGDTVSWLYTCDPSGSILG